MWGFLRSKQKQNSVQNVWNDSKVIADVTQIGGLKLLVKIVAKTVIVFAYLSEQFWNWVYFCDVRQEKWRIFQHP